jgi:hypothetical protein
MQATAERPLWRRLVPAVVVAAIGALLYAAIFIDRSPAPPTAGNPLPKQGDVKLTARDRASISRTLDIFLQSAVERRNVARSFDWVTPQMRGGKSRAQWKADRLPVIPYRSREQTAHRWRLTYAKPGEAGMELLLHPAKNEELGPIAFTIRVKQAGRRWLVDTWYANALFAKQGDRSNIVAVPDLGPAAVPGHGAADSRPSAAWIGIPLAIVLLPIMIGLLVGTVALVRMLRHRRRAVVDDERALVSWDAYRQQVRRDDDG